MNIKNILKNLFF
ncbi:hypothetical protein C923_05126 [Plasmodium falciparum UGT5.1]|uniref:Uncharacterized protein n=1 Tax=Plasmodium falciparum UGT5.1 TaxID=1237627 RepID=W7J6K0_PLAFA|nr:hypothetical protein C923_05126 [Plasmodium falciparum UGT5.1]